MKKRSKTQRALREKLTKKVFVTDEAFQFVAENPGAKFDESIDVAIRLGVDTKQADQQVRGALVLPHGIGKKVRILVFAKGDKEKEAQNAGADLVGSDDLIEKIQNGFLDFDSVIATPDMMAKIAKVARILGPKGLMPNPKLGTVTMDVAKAVKDEKGGKVEFRADKSGVVHTMIGKRSFGAQKLRENYQALMDMVLRMKPQSSKGNYVRSVTVSTTMGPGLALDVTGLG